MSASPDSPDNRSGRSLRRRLIVGMALAAIAVLGLLAYAGLYVLRRSMAGDADARIATAVSLSNQLVDRVLSERSRQVDMISSAPSVIIAAHKGSDSSRQRGLNKMSIPALEQMFKATRSQQVDNTVKDFLTDLLVKLDVGNSLQAVRRIRERRPASRNRAVQL